MSKHTVARQGSTYNRFAALPKAQIQRSVFNRSHDYKTTFDSGYLIPFYVDEVLPGDSFKLNCSIFCRLATPIVPFMDNLYLETFFSSFLIDSFGSIGRISWVSRITLVTPLII